MKLKHRMLGLLLVASVSAWGLTGCSGAECGEGTTDQDGTCVPEVTCGNGTKAEDGQCVVGDDGCAAGTSYDPESGTCVISGDDACAEGTTFNADTNTCVANISECGENTELNEDTGQCVPTLEAICDGMGAVKVEDGSCVVAEAACTEGTMLSANGNCVVAQEACGTGLELNDQGQCVPTDEVCGDKTSFDSDMGLCLPDETCQMGDKVVDGVCVSPAEALARQEGAVSEMENNDPDLGGTANDITLPDSPGTTTVFTGTIEAPRTIEGQDNQQDVDAFKFTGSAGDWVKLSVQSLGLPAPLMVVSGPNGYQRISPIARPALTETEMRKDDAGRKLVLPHDGDYTVSVLPTSQALDRQVDPAGADNWDYVGALEKVDAGMPTTQDVSMNALTGNFGNPENNFYKVTGFAAGDLLKVSFDKEGEDVSGVLQIWKDASTHLTSLTVEADETTLIPLPSDLQNDEFFVLLDWETLSGTDTGYEVSAEALTDTENLGPIMPDNSVTSTKVAVNEDANYYYTFSTQAGQGIEILNTNAEDEEIGYTLYDNAGNVLRSETDMEVPGDRFSSSGSDDGYYYTENGGDFTLEITAEDDNHTEQQVEIKSHTPNDLGMVGIGDSISGKVDGMGSVVLPEGRSDFHVITITEDITLDATLSPLDPSDGEIKATFYNPNYESQFFVDEDNGPINLSRTVLEAGKYVIRVGAEENINSYEVTGSAKQPPVVVGEPSNTRASATEINFTDQLLTSLQGGNDTDWMKFTIANDLPATESVWFNLGINSFETDDFACQLLDSNGNVVHEVSNRDEGCSLYGTGLKAGTYFVKVEYSGIPSYNTDETYLWLRQITASAESEPNDSMMSPNTPMLTRNGNRFSAIGTVEAGNTDDYFEFTLPSNIPSGAELHIGLTMLGPEHAEGTDWELFDSMGNSVVKKDYDEVHTISSPTAGATYTMQVIGDSSGLGSADGEYVLRAEVYNPDQTVTSQNTPVDFSGNTGQTTTDSVMVSSCMNVERVSVSIDAVADEKGEHLFMLTGPTGEEVTFWPAYEFGDDQEDFMMGNWPIQKVSRGDLSKFNGTNGNGSWTLTAVIDGAFSFETRDIKSWSLNLDCQ